MYRAVALMFVALSACGNSVDDRPATLPFIVQNILVPNCGSTECHSTMTQQQGYVFDTVAGTRRSLVGYVDPGDAAGSPLIFNLTTDTSEQPRMPYTAPLLDQDLALIETWIDDGAHGANCLEDGVNFCSTDSNVHSCVDGDDGGIVKTCDSHGCNTAAGECTDP